MNNETSHQPQPPMTLPEGIRHRLAGHALAGDDGAIRIVAASAQNWPELASLSVGEITLGDDGLIRLALWSASACCATLLGTRRATLLLPDEEGFGQIRCLVVANANLATQRPLSGFLLKPCEILGSHPHGAYRHRNRQTALKDASSRTSETRLALLDAFPVADGGEDTTLQGAPPP